jgi:hypothetical protein
MALRSFERIHLDPGASQKVRFHLNPRDLGMVSELGSPIIAEGDYSLSVGGGQPGNREPWGKRQVPRDRQLRTARVVPHRQKGTHL